MFNNTSPSALVAYANALPQKSYADILASYCIDFSSYNTLDRISIIEAIIAKHYPPIQDIIKPYHFIQDDLYFRAIEFPAGTVLTSKLHTQAHIGMILKGSAQVLTNYEDFVHVQAPNLYHCSPGTKRLILTLEDCVWVTVHKLTPEHLAIGLQDIDALCNIIVQDTDYTWASSIIDAKFNSMQQEVIS